MKKRLVRVEDGWFLALSPKQLRAIGVDTSEDKVLLSVEDGETPRLIISKVPASSEGKDVPSPP